MGNGQGFAVNGPDITTALYRAYFPINNRPPPTGLLIVFDIGRRLGPVNTVYFDWLLAGRLNGLQTASGLSG